MSGVSLGSSAITGVYVGGSLATGVFVGSTQVWPVAAGAFPIGRGTFEFAPQGLLVETDQTIRISPSALAFTGKLLSLAIGGNLDVNLGAGSLALTAQALQAMAAAVANVGAGSVALTGQALTASIGGAVAVAIQSGSIGFAGATLGVSTTQSAAVTLGVGSITFAGAALASATGQTASPILGAGSVAFTGMALAIAAGQSVSTPIEAGAVTFTGAAISPSVSASVDLGAGALAFVGEAMVVGNGTSLAVSMGAGSVAFSGSGLAFATTSGVAVNLGAAAIALAGAALVPDTASGPANDVAYIGALTPVAPSGGTQTMHLTLPTGTVAGDFVVVTGNMDGRISDGDGMSISGGVTLLAATSFGTDGETSCVIGKFLTSTDITNGYVAVSKTGPYSSSFTGLVARYVNTTTPLYAGSTWNPENTASTNPTATGTSIPVPTGGIGIWACFLDISGGDNGFINTPTGWTLAKLAQETFATQAIAYKPYASAGSTGAVGAATASSDQVAWAVWMGALNPA